MNSGRFSCFPAIPVSKAFCYSPKYQAGTEFAGGTTIQCCLSVFSAKTNNAPLVSVPFVPAVATLWVQLHRHAENDRKSQQVEENELVLPNNGKTTELDSKLASRTVHRLAKN